MVLTPREANRMTDTLITLMKNYQQVRDREESRMAGSQLVADEISRLEEKLSKLVKQRELLYDKFEEVYPVPDQTFHDVLRQVEEIGFEIHRLEIEIHRLEGLSS